MEKHTQSNTSCLDTDKHPTNTFYSPAFGVIFPKVGRSFVLHSFLRRCEKNKYIKKSSSLGPALVPCSLDNPNLFGLFLLPCPIPPHRSLHCGKNHPQPGPARCVGLEPHRPASTGWCLAGARSPDSAARSFAASLRPVELGGFQGLLRMWWEHQEGCGSRRDGKLGKSEAPEVREPKRRFVPGPPKGWLLVAPALRG